MGQSRRQRRKMERLLGIKSNKNMSNPESYEIRERKRKAGQEIHRQNLEGQRNLKDVQEGEMGNVENSVPHVDLSSFGIGDFKLSGQEETTKNS